MFTSSAFFALLFLGGYHLPLVPGLSPDDVGLGAVLAKFLVYFLKVVLIVCFMMVVRWTVPRMRYDQVMMMVWQAVIPLSLVVMILTAVMVAFDLTGVVPMLLANAALFAAMMAVLPMLPRYNPNRKIPLYGSRFSPVPGERVNTRPTDATALEDRPVQGALAR
jgi:NADH-quinone oxidoreductase subunit H